MRDPKNPRSNMVDLAAILEVTQKPQERFLSDFFRFRWVTENHNKIAVHRFPHRFEQLSDSLICRNDLSPGAEQLRVKTVVSVHTCSASFF
jgi:hypothetical protein